MRIECKGAGEQRYAFKAVEPAAGTGKHVFLEGTLLSVGYRESLATCFRVDLHLQYTSDLVCRTANMKYRKEKSSPNHSARPKLVSQYLTSSPLKPFQQSLSTSHYQRDPALLVQPTYCNLSPQEVQYFDRFQNQIAHQLGGHYSFDDFWFRTVLRESFRSEVILETILSIGALVQALENAPRNVPLYRISLPSASSHYADAVKYYTSSLAKLRSRLASRELEASPRNVLISTILFSTFELLQGNSISAERHITSGVSILKSMLMKSAWPNEKSQIAASYDDEGVEDAEFILMRRLSFKCLLSPLYSQERDSASFFIVPFTMGPSPPHANESFEAFWRAWMRFLTILQMWYIRVEPVAGRDSSTSVEEERLQQEQITLLVQIHAWEVAIKRKAEQECESHGKRVLRSALPGLKTIHFCVHTALDKIGELDAQGKEIAHEICRLAELVLEETPLLQAGLGDVYEGIQAISIGLAQRCRDFGLRSRAMAICKQILNVNSRWDGKKILMSTTALLELEEEGRDVTGSIPPTSRFDWVSSSWNSSYTELTAVFEAQVTEKDSYRERIQVILSPKDFGLV
jgi:hypothetical protein